MTASSTHCSAKTTAPLHERGRQRRALSLALLAACGSAALPPALAVEHALKEVGLESFPASSTSDSSAVAVVPPDTAIVLQRAAEGVLLTAQLHWSLPSLVVDALINGIPVHFIAEATLSRERWYWRNEVIMQAQRYWRLSYQPLNRRWRLYAGSVPFDGKGLGTALASSYDSLHDALNAMRRVVRWRLGPASHLPPSGDAVLEIAFRIDLSQFPRPLQIGVLGRADWNMLVERKERLALESV